MMNILKECLTTANSSLDQVKAFISVLSSQKSAISEFEKNPHLNKYIELSNFISCNRSIINSSVSYNAVIISLYGCLENYIDNLLGEYITLLSKSCKNYNELPENIRKKHQERLGDYLSNPQRYKGYQLTPDLAIKNFYNLLTSTVDFNENKDLIIAHSGNINCEQLATILKDLNINQPIQELLSNYYLEDFIKRSLNFSDTAYNRYKLDNPAGLFKYLEDLVVFRNAVAHGRIIENRINFSELEEKTLPFLRNLFISIYEVVLTAYYSFLYKKQQLTQLDLISNSVFDNHIICINTKNFSFHLGDIVFAISPNSKLVTLEIRSIELDHKKLKEITIPDVNIGIEFEKRPDHNLKDTWQFYFTN